MLLLSAPAVQADEQDSIVVFSAASTTEAVGPVAETFTRETGIGVVLSYGSSSSLARQIEYGAPADLYVSANMAWLDYLAERDLVDEESLTVVASNRLVIIVPADSTVADDGDWSRTLFTALGEDGRLALGDPDHVPAGIYAREALESAGLWERVADRLARTADVRGALALVSRGEAPAGLVYATDALITRNVRVLAVLPDDLHEPILYAAALVAGDGPPRAQAFLAMLSGPAGEEAFARAGFLPAP